MLNVSHYLHTSEKEVVLTTICQFVPDNSNIAPFRTFSTITSSHTLYITFLLFLWQLKRFHLSPHIPVRSCLESCLPVCFRQWRYILHCLLHLSWLTTTTWEDGPQEHTVIYSMACLPPLTTLTETRRTTNYQLFNSTIRAMQQLYEQYEQYKIKDDILELLLYTQILPDKQ